MQRTVVGVASAVDRSPAAYVAVAVPGVVTHAPAAAAVQTTIVSARPTARRDLRPREPARTPVGRTTLRWAGLEKPWTCTPFSLDVVGSSAVRRSRGTSTAVTGSLSPRPGEKRLSVAWRARGALEGVGHSCAQSVQ